MTLLPTESRDVVGLEGEGYDEYKVGAMCSRPGCSKWTDHAHHLFSRGNMGGAYTYVRLPDGTEVGNLVPLCFADHELITNNKIRITWANGQFIWGKDTPLSWQPPIKKIAGEHVPSEYSDSEYEPELDRHGRPICTGCGRLLPRIRQEIEKENDEAKKQRRTWAVSVPYTAMENGAATIDALLDAARDDMDRYGLDWGDGHKVKFYILSTALALFVQHSDAILSDGQVAAEKEPAAPIE